MTCRCVKHMKSLANSCLTLLTSFDLVLKESFGAEGWYARRWPREFWGAVSFKKSLWLHSSYLATSALTSSQPSETHKGDTVQSYEEQWNESLKISHTFCLATGFTSNKFPGAIVSRLLYMNMIEHVMWGQIPRSHPVPCCNQEYPDAEIAQTIETITFPGSDWESASASCKLRSYCDI